MICTIGKTSTCIGGFLFVLSRLFLGLVLQRYMIANFFCRDDQVISVAFLPRGDAPIICRMRLSTSFVKLLDTSPNGVNSRAGGLDG